jgi:hypothetical protein
MYYLPSCLEDFRLLKTPRYCFRSYLLGFKMSVLSL